MNGKLNIDLEKVVKSLVAHGVADRELLSFKKVFDRQAEIINLEAEEYSDVMAFFEAQEEIIPSKYINKNEIAARIGDLLERFEPWQQKELDLILNSLAYCGAAKAIRVVFKANVNESLKTEYIEMTCAKIIEDPDIF